MFRGTLNHLGFGTRLFQRNSLHLEKKHDYFHFDAMSLSMREQWATVRVLGRVGISLELIISVLYLAVVFKFNIKLFQYDRHKSYAVFSNSSFRLRQ